MKKFIRLVIVIEIVCYSYSYSRQPEEESNPYAVTTYECASLYWKVPESGTCNIRYCVENSSNWRDGPDLVYDTRNGDYRGSLIGLSPNNSYTVELVTRSAKTRLNIRTRSDRFPVGKETILIPGESDKPIIITESGTPDAYHLVTVAPGSKSVLNLKNVALYGIEIDADYVVVRGVEIRNSAIHGILIRKNRHDIVVEQCYIAFWGRIGGPKTYGNLDGGSDSGIFAESGCGNLTIQRNLIEDPRGASNDWETGHPDGPQGISVIQRLQARFIFSEMLPERAEQATETVQADHL